MFNPQYHTNFILDQRKSKNTKLNRKMLYTSQGMVLKSKHIPLEDVVGAKYTSHKGQAAWHSFAR